MIAYSAADYLKSEPRLGIQECRECVFAWRWPAREVEVSRYEALYTAQNDYFDPRAHRARAAMQIEFVKTLAPSDGATLLDVGAGLGFLVRAATDAGWSATGVELSAAAVDYGRQTLGCSMLRGTLEDLRGHPPFDVVTMFDVIEHVEDPLCFLRQASAMLKPGGWLVVETGNFASFGRIDAGLSWWAFQSIHYWLLTPAVMKRLLSAVQCGNFVIPHEIFRPEASRRPPARPRYYVKRALLNPRNAMGELRKAWQMRRARREWDTLAELEIFVIAGQRTG